MMHLKRVNSFLRSVLVAEDSVTRDARRLVGRLEAGVFRAILAGLYAIKMAESSG
jgi:hypothetical protein